MVEFWGIPLFKELAEEMEAVKENEKEVQRSRRGIVGIIFLTKNFKLN